MGRYGLVIGPAFLRTLRQLDSAERAEARRLLELIQLDPSIDGVYKIVLAPEAPFTTYVSPRFVVFYFVEGSTVCIVDIDHNPFG